MKRRSKKDKLTKSNFRKLDGKPPFKNKPKCREPRKRKGGKTQNAVFRRWWFSLGAGRTNQFPIHQESRKPSGWRRSSIPAWRSFSNIEICRWPFTFETCSSNLDEQVSDSEESANSKNQMAKRNLQNRSNFDLRCIWALMYDNGLEVLYV